MEKKLPRPAHCRRHPARGGMSGGQRADVCARAPAPHSPGPLPAALPAPRSFLPASRVPWVGCILPCTVHPDPGSRGARAALHPPGPALLGGSRVLQLQLVSLSLPNPTGCAQHRGQQDGDSSPSRVKARRVPWVQEVGFHGLLGREKEMGRPRPTLQDSLFFRHSHWPGDQGTTQQREGRT